MTNWLSNRDYLVLRAYQSGITDARELAAFMGQMEVESSGFSRMHENLNYSGKRLLQVFPGRNGIDSLVEANAIAAQGPEVVANTIYGGDWGRENLGNTHVGDGWNFRGRGYVQLTGRDNYLRDGNQTGLDLIRNPELAADQQNAATIAVHYWQSRVVQRGHQFNVREATHDINGGYKNLPERRAAIAKWEKLITPHVIERLSKGEVQLPASRRDHSQRRAVMDLQNGLNVLAVGDNENAPLTVDGNFGPKTSQAVRKFQRHSNLPATGTADPMTLAVVTAAARATLSARNLETANQVFLPDPYRPRQPEHKEHGFPYSTDALVASSEMAHQSRITSSPPQFHKSNEHVLPPESPSHPSRITVLRSVPEHMSSHRAADSIDHAEPGHRLPSPASFFEPATLEANPVQLQLAQLQQEVESLRRHVQRPTQTQEISAIRVDREPEPAARPIAPTDEIAYKSQSLPYCDPRHPEHRLYAELKERLPQASEDRLVQFTAACHMNGIEPDRLGQIVVRKDAAVLAASWPPGAFVTVDITTPPPTQEQVMQQVFAHDHQQALDRSQFMEQQRQANERSGPVM